MRKKLRAKQGETLLETLISILIIAMVFVFLSTAIVTAAKINAKARDADSSFRYEAESTGEKVLIISGGGLSGTIPVERYQHNGYYYYDKK